jgi:hypothetical protein
MDEEQSTTRKSFNEIIPGSVYQRGQIMTWQRDDKIALLKSLHINIVVNFWPKIDPDMTDLWYFHMATNRSIDMIDPKIEFMAYSVAQLIREQGAALVLCEAGKTRSVFFCTLLISELQGISMAKARLKMDTILPTHRMKNFMLDYLDKQV